MTQTPTPHTPTHPPIPTPKSHIRKVSVQLATQLKKTAELDRSLSLITVLSFTKGKVIPSFLQFQQDSDRKVLIAATFLLDVVFLTL